MAVGGEWRIVPQGAKCEWRIADKLVAVSLCSERVSGRDIALPYPGGAEISVNAVGEPPLITDASVKDLLIAGLGDSFASGEGNPEPSRAIQRLETFSQFLP